MKLLLVVSLLQQASSTFVWKFGHDDPGGCDTVGTTLEQSLNNYIRGREKSNFLIGGYTKSTTQILGTNTGCLDRGVAMILKFKAQDRTLLFAKYFEGRVLGSDEGSYTDVSALQVPGRAVSSAAKNIEKMDGLIYAFLEYQTKTNTKDINKNMLIVLDHDNGNVISSYLCPTGVPKYQNLVVVAHANRNYGDKTLDYAYLAYVLPENQDFKVHFFMMYQDNKMRYGHSTDSIDTKFGATAFDYYEEDMFVGGTRTDASDAGKFQPCILSLNSPYKYYTDPSSALSTKWGNCITAGLQPKQGGHGVELLQHTQYGSKGIFGFMVPRDGSFGIEASDYFYLLYVHIGVKSPQFEVMKVKTVVSQNYKRRFLWVNQNQNNFYFAVVEEGLSSDLTLINGNNANYYFMDGTSWTRSGNDITISLTGGQTATNNEYFTKAAIKRVTFGRSCFTNGGQDYCHLVQMNANARIQTTSDYSHKSATMLITTTKYSEDAAYVSANAGNYANSDCMDNYINNKVDPQIKAINTQAGNVGKAILMIGELFWPCFDIPSASYNIGGFEVDSNSLTLASVATGTMTIKDEINCFTVPTYTIAKSSDHLTGPLAVEVWKETKQTVTFSDQFTITACATEACTKCPIVVQYFLSSSGTSLTTIDYPQRAIYDRSLSKYSLVFPQKTLDGSTIYQANYFLTQVVNFDLLKAQSRVHFADHKVIPAHANHYFYPSCKPSCLNNGNLIPDALYYREATNDCLRFKEPVERPESLLLTGGALFDTVTCKSLFTKCAAAEKFELVSTDIFEWKLDASQFPIVKDNLFQFLQVGSTTTPTVKLFQGPGEATSTPTGSLLTNAAVDSNAGKITFSGSPTEIPLTEVRLEFAPSPLRECFFNDMRKYLPKKQNKFGKISIDDCVGQEVQLMKQETQVVRIQKNKGSLPLIGSESELFGVKEKTKCPIRKYEVLSMAGQPLTSSDSAYQALYLSQRSDLAALKLNLNSAVTTSVQVTSFSVKASTNLTPFALAKFKVILGCYEQSKITVEYIEDADELTSKLEGSLFKIEGEKNFQSPGELPNVLSVDLKKVLKWSTDIDGCSFSKVSICSDEQCTETEVEGVKLDAVILNEETGIVPPMMLKIDTSNLRTQEFYLKTEVPGGVSSVDKVQVDVIAPLMNEDAVKKIVNYAPIFSAGLGEVETIIVSKIMDVTKFVSNKATDYEENEISIRIKGDEKDFLKFGTEVDHFVVEIDQTKIKSEDVGKNLTYSVILGDDVSAYKRTYAFYVQIEEGVTEGLSVDEANGDTDGLSEEKVTEIRKSFEEFQARGKGVVTREEVLQLLKKNEIELTEQGTDELVKIVDKIGEGEIKGEQFTAEVVDKIISYLDEIAVEKQEEQKQQNWQFSTQQTSKPNKVFQGVVPSSSKDNQVSTEKETEEEKVEPIPLLATIYDISTLGLVQIQFNQPLKVDLLDASNYNQYFKPILETGEYEKTSSFNMSKLEFVWDITSFDEDQNTFYMQVNFTNALHVSKIPELRDKMVIQFLDYEKFVSAEFNLPLGVSQYPDKRSMQSSPDKSSLRITSEITKQMPNDETTKNFDKGTEGADTSLTSTTIIMFLLNMVFAGAVKETIVSIMSLQNVIHMLLFMLPFPANIVNYLSKIKPIASFNVVKSLSKFIMQLLPQDSTKQNENKVYILSSARDLGVKTHNTIANLTNIFIMMCFLGLDFFKYLLMSLTYPFTTRFQKRRQALAKDLFFGRFITLSTGGFIPMSIAFYLGIQRPVHSGYGEEVSNAVTYIVGFIIFVFYPLAMIANIMVSKEKLLEPGYKQMWGGLYAPNRIETRWQRAFRLQFILKRFLILFIAFYIYHNPLYQILLIAIMNKMSLIYMGVVGPLKDQKKNQKETYNEGLVLLMTIHLFCFSDANPDVDIQYMMGWSFSLFLTIYILYNGGPIVKDMFKKFKLLAIKTFRKFQRWRGIRSVMIETKINEVADQGQDEEESSSESEQENKKIIKHQMKQRTSRQKTLSVIHEQPEEMTFRSVIHEPSQIIAENKAEYFSSSESSSDSNEVLDQLLKENPELSQQVAEVSKLEAQLAMVEEEIQMSEAGGIMLKAVQDQIADRIQKELDQIGQQK